VSTVCKSATAAAHICSKWGNTIKSNVLRIKENQKSYKESQLSPDRYLHSISTYSPQSPHKDQRIFTTSAPYVHTEIIKMLLDLIGLISGVLGVVGFIQDQLPDKPEPENPDDPNKYGINLRLTVGLAGVTPPEGGDPLAEPDGMINQVAHYDNAGNIIVGIAAPGMIEDGHFTDIKVMSTNGRQAAVTTVWGTPQNVCIATMGITFSDGTRFGWVGDVSHANDHYSVLT
jgi:hypothetical protein